MSKSCLENLFSSPSVGSVAIKKGGKPLSVAAPVKVYVRVSGLEFQVFNVLVNSSLFTIHCFILPLQQCQNVLRTCMACAMAAVMLPHGKGACLA